MDRPGTLGAGLRADHQHAVEQGRLPRAGPVARAGQLEAAPAAFQFRFGGRSTDIVIEREEARARPGRDPPAPPPQGQADFLRRHGEAALEPGRFRQMAARAGKQRRRGRMRMAGIRPDRQSQRQFCLAQGILQISRHTSQEARASKTARYCRVRCLCKVVIGTAGRRRRGSRNCRACRRRSAPGTGPDDVAGGKSRPGAPRQSRSAGRNRPGLRQ